MPEVIDELKFNVKSDTSQAEQGLLNLAKIVEGLKESVASLTSALKVLNGTEASNKTATDGETKAKKTAYQQTMADIRAKQQEANITNANARLKATLARATANATSTERLNAQATLESARAKRENSQTILEDERAKRMNVQSTLESAKADRMGAQSTFESARAVRMDAQARYEAERAKRLEAQASAESARTEKVNAQAAYDNARASTLNAKAKREQKKAQEESTKAKKKDTAETSKNSKAHDKATKSTHRHASGLARLAAALKRIVIYRALRGAIKSVTQALGEGIQRMYEWSEANDQVFMHVMDTYATEMQYLKDAIGAALAPLIEMLMPVLVRLVDGFVELINVVNQFFRALAGYDTWLKVEKVAAKFATDTDNAAKAQKALNNQLMDFDQLNLITTPKSSGSTEYETPALTGHYTDIDPKIKAMAESFKEFLKPLKEMKTILNDIWDILQPIINDFISGALETASTVLADIKDIMQSFDDSGVFDAIGQLIDESNKATWELIKTVADAVTSMVTKIAETGALTYLIDAIRNLSVGGIDNTIKLIKSLDEDGIIDMLAYGVADLMYGIGSVLIMVADIAEFLTDIADKILPGIIGSGSGGLSLVGELLESISGTVGGILEMLKSLLGMDGNFWSGLYELIWSAFIKPILGIVKVIMSIVEAVDKALHPNNKTVVAKWEEIHRTFNDLERGFSSLEEAEETLNDFFTDHADDITTHADLSKKSLEELYEEAKSGSAKAKDAAKSAVSEAYAKLNELRAQGKISLSEYMIYSEQLATKNAKTAEGQAEIYRLLNEINTRWYSSTIQMSTDVTNILDQISKKWKTFADNGKYWGSTFRQNFLDQLKSLNNTQITMKPGQQSNWNKATISMTTMASGGFPDMGSLFVAGETNSPEMVGTINGRTAVASGMEITGIADAVYGTSAEERSLLRELIGAVRGQRLTISPSASLGKVVNQSQRLYQGVTG